MRTKVSLKQNIAESIKKEKVKRSVKMHRYRKELLKLKPNNCLLHMHIYADKNMVDEFPGVLAPVGNSGTEIHVIEQTIPYSVTWKRMLSWDDFSDEHVVLLIWKMEELCSNVENNAMADIQKILNVTGEKKVIVAVLDLDKISGKSMQAVHNTEKSKVAHNKSVEIDMYMTELQLKFDVSCIVLNEKEELASLLERLTKSVAEAPYKLQKQTEDSAGVGWLVTCDIKGTVRVDKAGNGLTNLWLQQLTQFSNCSLEAAKTIAAFYPTPISLFNAFCHAPTEEQGKYLLKDLIVRRASNSCKESKIGPELSKNIYWFFMSTDGDMLLSQT